MGLGGAFSASLIGGVGAANAKESNYNRLRAEGLVAETEVKELDREAKEKIFTLDREAKEVEKTAPDLISFLVTSEGVALAGAIFGGLAARNNGIELAAEKKKLEEKLLIEEELLSKLKRVNKQLKLEQRVTKARELAAAGTECSIDVSMDDEDYNAVRAVLKKGRAALSDGHLARRRCRCMSTSG